MVSPTDSQLNIIVFESGKQHPAHVGLVLQKQTLQTILQRALNTWSDVPPEVLQFSDSIDKI